jgi:UDP-galactopyranose mutase
MADDCPLIVFSHLRWDFVFQRPQHLLSRLAQTRRVLCIEEPVSGEGSPRWQRLPTEHGVVVLRPVLSGEVRGFHPEHEKEVGRLLQQLVRDDSLQGSIAWLYTPMALPLARHISPSVLVYDCMDELSLFQGAPPELLDREAELLRDADLVFTGGPSLYKAKKDRNPDVHCFPSSVDAAHFRLARHGSDMVSEPAEQAALSHPRLGFYGVIDERLDVALLDSVARERPEWQIVLVGPVVKIDPATLPRHPNIHYFGQQGYDQLPRFLAGWDVCLLPFARNDATRFISPTKTLEYMAAERPVVSTPITDVAEPYGDVVFLGDTPGEFIAGIEAALELEEDEKETIVARMREIVEGTSWERTAKQMDDLLNRVLLTKSGEPGTAPHELSPIAATTAQTAGLKV